MIFKAVATKENIHNIVNVREDTGCWEWTLAKNKGGYGICKSTLAHRVAYEWFVEKPPADLDLMHLCHNRCCVNPAHLRPGTRKENVDMSIKDGRWDNELRSKNQKIIKERDRVNGYIIGRNRRFTDNQIRGIRKLVELGISEKMIADSLYVTKQAIRAICQKKVYAYVS